jgi:hypothetical protein
MLELDLIEPSTKPEQAVNAEWTDFVLTIHTALEGWWDCAATALVVIQSLEPPQSAGSNSNS